MITIKHGRARLTLKPEHAQEAHDMLARIDKGKRIKLPAPKGNPKLDSRKRHYPVFTPGMATADYVARYVALNYTRLHLAPIGHTHADRPAPMLDPSFPEAVQDETL